jgi:hypothetical protein
LASQRALFARSLAVFFSLLWSFVQLAQQQQRQRWPSRVTRRNNTAHDHNTSNSRSPIADTQVSSEHAGAGNPPVHR